jgi:hypothetical protein
MQKAPLPCVDRLSDAAHGPAEAGEPPCLVYSFRVCIAWISIQFKGNEEPIVSQLFTN